MHVYSDVFLPHSATKVLCRPADLDLLLESLHWLDIHHGLSSAARHHCLSTTPAYQALANCQIPLNI